jgi:hypothetical protein
VVRLAVVAAVLVVEQPVRWVCQGRDQQRWAVVAALALLVQAVAVVQRVPVVQQVQLV